MIYELQHYRFWGDATCQPSRSVVAVGRVAVEIEHAAANVATLTDCWSQTQQMLGEHAQARYKASLWIFETEPLRRAKVSSWEIPRHLRTICLMMFDDGWL